MNCKMCSPNWETRLKGRILIIVIVQYIPRNTHMVFALRCFVVVIHWLIFPYPSGLLHWQCGNLTIAPVPAKQPWWIWINTSCEFIMNDCITTTKQSTTKPCAYFLGYTVLSYCWILCLPSMTFSVSVSYVAIEPLIFWMFNTLDNLNFFETIFLSYNDTVILLKTSVYNICLGVIMSLQSSYHHNIKWCWAIATFIGRLFSTRNVRISVC